MSSLLYRIGQACFRHRRVVLAVWIVVIAGLAVLAVSVKQPTTDSFTIPGTESQQALNLLDQKFPGTGGAQAQAVFSVPAGQSLTTSAHREAIESTLAQLRKLPQVVSVSDPFSTGTISKNGQIAYAVVAYPVAVADVTAHAQTALLDSGGPAKAAGITVNFGGQVAQAQTKTDTEVVGIIVAFLILLIGFGSVIVGILPLVSALAGVAATNLALLALTSVINESSTTSVLATMIGLAVGVDYSLFVLNRHRQHLIEGMEPDEAIGRAAATSGSAVCFAGATVLIALAALSIVNIPFLTVMGLAAAGAVVVAVLAAVTLMPALAGLRRDKVDLEPLGPPQDRQGGQARIHTALPSLCHDAQAGTDPGGPRRDHRPPGRRHPLPPPAPRPARPGLPAHEPDHAAGVRPRLRRIRPRLQRTAADRGLRARRDHALPEAGVRDLLQREEGESARRHRLHRRPHREPGRRRDPGDGRPQDRSERPGHHPAHRQDSHRRRSRREAVRPGDLRDRSDGGQH